MRCEKDIEKIGLEACNGQYCQADGVDAVRIAQNFTASDLESRVSRVRQQLQKKPGSCELQHALNQLSMARKFQGGSNNGN